MPQQQHWQPPISSATTSSSPVQAVEMHQQHQQSANTYSALFVHVQPSTYHPHTFSTPTQGGAYIFSPVGAQLLVMCTVGLVSLSPATTIQHTCPTPTPWKELISLLIAFSPALMNQVNLVTPYSEAAYLPSQFTPRQFQSGCHHHVFNKSIIHSFPKDFPPHWMIVIEHVIIGNEVPYFPDIEAPIPIHAIHCVNSLPHNLGACLLIFLRWALVQCQVCQVCPVCSQINIILLVIQVILVIHQCYHWEGVVPTIKSIITNLPFLLLPLQ